jgi:hypothetical protein
LTAGGAKRWIIDLQAMGGGDMWPVLAGLGGLLHGPIVGGFASKTDAVQWIVAPGRSGLDGVGPIIDTHEPSHEVERDLSVAPVAVLIGPGTRSAGEALAIAFIGRPDVRIFGAPSAGFTNSAVQQVLSGHRYLFGIVTALNMDRRGTIHQGPVQPDVLAPPIEMQQLALQWLSSEEVSQDVH